MTLTPRQRQILALVAEGYTDREIGERIGLATKTVENMMAAMREGLFARTRAHLVHIAWKQGLLAPTLIGSEP